MYSLRNRPQSEQTADPSKYPNLYFKDKQCKKCSKVFSPKAPSHLYCSDECANISLQDAYLKRNYGITLDIYLKMCKEQNDKCYLCNGEGFVMDKTKHKLKLVVDHDHKTGKVRKLLCHNCNRALGLFKDNPDVLNKAAIYVEEKDE